MQQTGLTIYSRDYLLVSILTRPGGRVQPIIARYHPSRSNEFQSSPVPEDGCNLGALKGVWSAPGFNPHPSRRTGATGEIDLAGLLKSNVSILTRPEGRVQPNSPARSSPRCEFQSSPVPKDGCNV